MMRLCSEFARERRIEDCKVAFFGSIAGSSEINASLVYIVFGVTIDKLAFEWVWLRIYVAIW